MHEALLRLCGSSTCSAPGVCNTLEQPIRNSFLFTAAVMRRESSDTRVMSKATPCQKLHRPGPEGSSPVLCQVGKSLLKGLQRRGLATERHADQHHAVPRPSPSLAEASNLGQQSCGGCDGSTLPETMPILGRDEALSARTGPPDLLTIAVRDASLKYQ